MFRGWKLKLQVRKKNLKRFEITQHIMGHKVETISDVGHW